VFIEIGIGIGIGIGIEAFDEPERASVRE